MSEIKNTTAAMQNPVEQMGLLAEGIATGSPAGFIERQERDGQRQLVNSDRLPSGMGDQADYEGLGFTFGEPDDRDPMFRPATLPPGWQREGSDHAMWSYINDDRGRRRVAIFYKAAFYDRSAFMRLETVYGYVMHAIDYAKAPVILDEKWATRDAVAEALTSARDDAQEKVTFWREHNDERYVADYTERAGRYERVRAEILEAGKEALQ